MPCIAAGDGGVLPSRDEEHVGVRRPSRRTSSASARRPAPRCRRARSRRSPRPGSRGRRPRRAPAAPRARTGGRRTGRRPRRDRCRRRAAARSSASWPTSIPIIGLLASSGDGTVSTSTSTISPPRSARSATDSPGLTVPTAARSAAGRAHLAPGGPDDHVALLERVRRRDVGGDRRRRATPRGVAVTSSPPPRSATAEATLLGAVHLGAGLRRALLERLAPGGDGVARDERGAVGAQERAGAARASAPRAPRRRRRRCHRGRPSDRGRPRSATSPATVAASFGT